MSDIITLLRVLSHHTKKLSENENLHDLYRDAFTRCEELTLKASSEITQLRQEVKDLRAERDEARREVCGLDADIMEDQIEYAKHRGWDCFKETP